MNIFVVFIFVFSEKDWRVPRGIKVIKLYFLRDRLL